MPENKNIFHICLCADNNYIRHCAVTMLSVKRSNPYTDICYHLVIGETLTGDNRRKCEQFAAQNRINLQIHVIDESLLDGVKFRQKRPLSKAAYYRLLLSSALPEDIDKVLYLDSDILVLRDITPLLKLDIAGYALAATRDMSTMHEGHRLQLRLPYKQPYFCSGMMLVNLKYWRENNVEPMLIELAKRERTVYYHDQDVLNYAFKGHWFRLSPVWNRFYPVFYPDSHFENDSDRYVLEHNPYIVHFFNYFKPWNAFKIKGKLWDKYRGIYAGCLSMTPWKGAPLNTSHLNDRDSYRMYSRYKWETFFYRINMHGFYLNLLAFNYFFNKIILRRGDDK